MDYLGGEGGGIFREQRKKWKKKEKKGRKRYRNKKEKKRKRERERKTWRWRLHQRRYCCAVYSWPHVDWLGIFGGDFFNGCLGFFTGALPDHAFCIFFWSQLPSSGGGRGTRGTLFDGGEGFSIGSISDAVASYLALRKHSSSSSIFQNPLFLSCFFFGYCLGFMRRYPFWLPYQDLIFKIKKIKKNSVGVYTF